MDHSQLQDYFSPYDQIEKYLLEIMATQYRLPAQVEQAATASAIQIMEQARKQPNLFSLRQIFQRYPIHTPEAQTLFQLITQLCHITDFNAQQAFIHECFHAAHWMTDTQRRDAFFSATSSWGMSMANRFFSGSTSGQLNQKSSGLWFTQKIARRFGSPIMHKTIMQAVNRLTDPLIYANTWQDALQKANTTPTHLRPSFEYGFTPSIAKANQKGYIELLDALALQLQTQPHIPSPSIQLELHHFTGPVDIRQSSRLEHLMTLLTPIFKTAIDHKLLLVLSVSQPFANSLIRKIMTRACRLFETQLQVTPCIGMTISAAEPSSMILLETMLAMALQKGFKIPVRLTKERTKPSLSQNAVIHVAYLSLTQYLLQNVNHFVPSFVTHHAFTLACVHHLANHYQASFEVQNRCNVGEMYQAAFSAELNQAKIRLEAPLGAKHTHHHMILQRLREITDPEAFLNQMYNDNITTAALVTSPWVKLRRTPLQTTDFWRGQYVRPHQPLVSVLPQLVIQQEIDVNQAQALLVSNKALAKLEATVSIEDRRQRLHNAHQHAVNNSALWIQILVDVMDTPRGLAEIMVEAALQQQRQRLEKAIVKSPQHEHYSPKGQVLFIGSGLRPLSPLLEQMTLALLTGNSIVVKPSTTTSVLIEQVFQTFWLAGFNTASCCLLTINRQNFCQFLKITTSVDTIIFDGLQPQAKALSQSTILNPTQPPIPFNSIPAARCISTQGICLIDESSSDQEFYNLVADAWKLGPLVILTTASMVAELHQALLEWRQYLIIGPANDRDTHLSRSQVLQPFPLDIEKLCSSLALEPPISIPAPAQHSPYFQLIVFNDQILQLLLQQLSQGAQLNRFTLLSRMPTRINTIVNSGAAIEFHLGWPKDFTSVLFQGLDQDVYEKKTFILRHQRLHPWQSNETFDMTDL